MGQFDEGFKGDKSNSMRVEGIESCLDAFRNLPKIITTKHLSRAMATAVQPMVNELRALTPRGPTGNLYNSVGFRVRKYGGATGAVFGIVGYRRSVSQPTGDTKGYHSSWIEIGTNDRTPKTAKALSSFALAQTGYIPQGWRFTWPMENVRKAKGIRGYHPLGRAFSTTASQCANILAAELEVALDRAIDEARQKGLD